MGVARPDSGINWKDLYNLLQAGVYTLLGYPNLRTGTTVAQIQVSAFDFRLGNQIYTKAAEDNVAVTLTNTNATQFRKVRVQINTAGTLSFSEGAPATAQVLAAIPRRTAALATVGWIEIPASFTYGTTSFSAAGVAMFNGDPDLGAGSGVPENDRGISTQVITST